MCLCVVHEIVVTLLTLESVDAYQNSEIARLMGECDMEQERVAPVLVEDHYLMVFHQRSCYQIGVNILPLHLL